MDINYENNFSLELRTDTLFKRSSDEFWNHNKFGYKTLSKKEKDSIKILIYNILNEKIKNNYTSISHSIPYQYEVNIFKNKKENFSISIYSEELPEVLNDFINYINKLAKKKFKEIRIRPAPFSNFTIETYKIKDSIENLSYILSYKIWKKTAMITNQKGLITAKTKYSFHLNYPFNYKGKRIENLATDNLQDFYYELDNKFYSFKLEEPLQIKP